MSTNVFDWTRFLQQWSADVLASPLAEGLPDLVRQNRWVGFPAASDEEIRDAEQRLKIPLPRSYAAFLRVSNGFRRPTHGIDMLRGVEPIEWFRKAHKDWIKALTVP